MRGTTRPALRVGLQAAAVRVGGQQAVPEPGAVPAERRVRQEWSVQQAASITAKRPP